jgi:nucleoside-diphosphate-sugar epimerase
MRIALTGATGFVGQALLPLLLAAGYNVIALVRNPATSQVDHRVTLVQGDLNHETALLKLTENVDVVLHVAGVVSGVSRRDFFHANVDGTVALAEAARRNGVKHFIFVSSLAAREPALNYYGESKAAAEAAMQKFSGGMRLTILRPSAVYGPGDKATLPLLKTLLASTAFIPGTAAARFGMVHVDDVAKVLLDAMNSDRAGVFEIDDGSGGHSWADIVVITQAAFGLPKRVVYIPRAAAMALGCIGDAMANLRGKPSLLNTGQLRQIYHDDWRVKGRSWSDHTFITLSDGLPDTIRWYHAQGLLPLPRATDRRPTHKDTTGDTP